MGHGGARVHAFVRSRTALSGITPNRYEQHRTFAAQHADHLQCTHPPVPRQIWEYNSDERAWRPTIELAHDGPVRCVDWAPKMGRSSHNIATAQGASVKIWELEDSSRPQKEQPSHVLIANAEGEDEAAAAEVWRVKWNITGTVLASSGDDGQVRLWKPDPTSGEWVERAQVTG